MDANTQTYITQFSDGEADLTAAQEFYDDIVANYLAEIPVLTGFNTSLAVSGNSASLPATAVQPLQVFYNNETLGILTIAEANFLFDDWRDTIGVPFNRVDEGAANRTQILLAPKPPTPASNVQAIYTETRQSLPTYLQLPVAFLCLYFEYSRESNHRNMPLAQAYKAMGELLISVVKAEK